jgi:hypothetical protein
MIGITDKFFQPCHLGKLKIDKLRAHSTSGTIDVHCALNQPTAFLLSVKIIWANFRGMQLMAILMLKSNNSETVLISTTLELSSGCISNACCQVFNPSAKKTSL